MFLVPLIYLVSDTDYGLLSLWGLGGIRGIFVFGGGELHIICVVILNYIPLFSLLLLSILVLS